MKDLFMLMVIAIVCKGTASISSMEWEEFKFQFGKVYNNHEEEQFRLQVFNKNKQKVEKHNAEYDQGVHTFKMGINYFSDMELHEFSRIMNGFIQRGRSIEDGRKQFVASPNTKLPQNVDWRRKGAVTEVKYQGPHCGSCWAFSATGSLEGQHFLKTGELISLSEQDLIDCSTDYGNRGCHGGLINNAFKYVIDNGINTESSYPYKTKEGVCMSFGNDSATTVTGYVYIAKGNELALQEAVATVGPISVAIDANHDSIKHYKEGVIYEENCSSTRHNHAVLIVGYGTDINHGDYWLIKNSWGKRWGMNGYLKIARNRDNHCGIATSASYPEVI